MFSRASRYAIRALAYMAQQPQRGPFDIRAVGAAVRVPPSYLAKVFQSLVRVGIVESQRGASGGYRLVKSAKQIKLIDVINAIDNVQNLPLFTCVMGLERCSDQDACPLHDIWVQSTKKMKRRLQKTTIASLGEFNQRLRSFEKSRRLLSNSLRAVFK